MLQFGEHQMYWECLELNAYETSWYRQIYLVSKISLDRESHNPQHVTDPKAIDYDIWGQIVMEYSACDLTFPEKDKFIAISSVARKLCAEDTYVAGLWKDDLPNQLNWATARERASAAAQALGELRPGHGLPLTDPFSFRNFTYPESTPSEGEDDEFGQIVSAKIQVIYTLTKLNYITQNMPNTNSFSLIENETAYVHHDIGKFQEGELFTCMPTYLSENQIMGLILERTTSRPKENILVLGDLRSAIKAISQLESSQTK
ncbi:MAG: hypothetical protein Q9225_006589 [Loekoesia sp. 1 TL-2023]